LPMIGLGQTPIPDANFEQALINLGYDTGTPNGSVPTANINTVTSLYVNSQNIADLTGIEDFSALTHLDCFDNQIMSLDISNNVALEYLKCNSNQLTSLDLTNNIALLHLQAGYNSIPLLDLSQNILLEVLAMATCAVTCPATLTQLDVTANTELTSLHLIQHNISFLDLSNCNKIQYLSVDGNPLGSLDLTNLPQLLSLTASGCQLTTLNTSNNPLLKRILCRSNQLSTLDLSFNYSLQSLECQYNSLTSIDLRNGNNNNLVGVWSSHALNIANNPYLHCINVDDATWSINNWIDPNLYQLDSSHYFSNNCSGTTSIQEHTTNKELLKVIDLLGRETKESNQPLFYIYDDGSVEKRIQLDR